MRVLQESGFFASIINDLSEIFDRGYVFFVFVQRSHVRYLCFVRGDQANWNLGYLNM